MDGRELTGSASAGGKYPDDDMWELRIVTIPAAISRATTLARRDWWIASLIFVVSLAMRVPLRSEFAFHWDGAQFALAIGTYDMSVGQPHAPGFFLYVMLGRAVNLLVGDPHASLVWISVFSGAALCSVGYLLATSMFGRACGLAAAAILASSPLSWFHGEVALTNIVDALLITATVLVIWLTVNRGGNWSGVVAMGALLAAVAGIRPQSAPVLLPAWLVGFWMMRPPRLLKAVVGVVVTALLCICWFVPMISLTGGLGRYLDLLLFKGRFDAPKTLWGGGMAAVQSSFDVILASVWVGLLIAAVLAATQLFLWFFLTPARVRRDAYRSYWPQLILLVAWLAPMLAFGLAVYTTMPGYVLSYFPAVAIFVGLGLSKLCERIAAAWMLRRSQPLALTAVVFVVIACNCAVFLFAPRWADRLLQGLPLTARHIREHDHALAKCFAAIRAGFHPSEAVICHREEFFFWGFRHFQYHLPEYRNILLTTDSSLPGNLSNRFWLGHLRRTEYIESVEKFSGLSRLLVVPPGWGLEIFWSHFEFPSAREVEGTDGTVYALAPALPQR